jgi:hypothetical protein
MPLRPRAGNPDAGRLSALTIFSTENMKLRVEAQYNPKELQIERPVPWVKHQLTNSGSARAKADAAAGRGHLQLEFTGSESRSMTIELLFDGFEQNRSVEPQIDILDALAQVRDPQSSVEEMRRPYRCVVLWGETLRKFQCVIESLTVKYTMFSRTGVPLRATCMVKLKECDSTGTSNAEKSNFSGVEYKPPR